MKTLAIIGGGASGLAAAVAAGRELRERGLRDEAEVVVFEADERVGRSILATGNGRCNFSNANPCVEGCRNADFVRDAYQELSFGQARRREARRSRSGRDALSESAVLEFFVDLGLCWREEAEGRLYPQANKASSVLDVLRAGLDDAGVQVSCERAVVRIDAPRRDGEHIHLRFADGAIEHVDAAIVAVGGRAIEKLELPRGLGRVKTEPTLGPLRTDTAVIRQLNNIRVRCAVTLESSHGRQKARETGEVLFRDYGVSGIAVFNLSRYAKPGDVLAIDFVPEVDAEDMETFLYTRRKCIGEGDTPLTCERFLCGLLLPQVAEVVLKQAGLRGNRPFSKADVPKLAATLKRVTLEVRGIGDVKQCQVARGGLAVDGFEPRTMAARAIPGLFAAGEALDVDAPCGGHNLHWAWSSGILAGRNAVSFVADGLADA